MPRRNCYSFETGVILPPFSGNTVKKKSLKSIIRVVIHVKAVKKSLGIEIVWKLYKGILIKLLNVGRKCVNVLRR